MPISDLTLRREEHFVRSPDCPFFALINSSHSPAGKKGKAKKGRASKASRLSTQSQLTVASEAPSFLEQTAQEDDSVLTTATMATSQGRKGAKAKKTAVAKGKKLKAKKDEIAEEVPAPEPEDEGFEVKVDVVEPKPTRGRKRKSAESVDASLLVSEAPAPKRRNTRTRASTAIDASALDDTVTEADTEMQKPARKKGRTSTKKTARKASIASIASLRAAVPDDDELDRALLADLERPLTDEEDNKPASIAPIRRGTRLSRITKVDHAMFGAEALEFDEAAIDAELEAMDAESKALPPLPKAKGAKGKQPRKVSAKQQAAAKKAAEAEVANEAEAAAQQEKMQEEKMQEEEAENQITAELEDSVTMQHVSPVALPKGRKAGSRQTSRQIPARATRASALSANDTNSSMADVSHGTIEDIGNETDASVAVQSTTIKGKKARGGKETKSKTAKRGASKNTEEIVSKTEIALEEINVSAMDVDTDDVPTATQEVEAEPEELMEDALSEELMLIDTKGDAEEIRPPIPEAQETIAMAPSPSPARTRVSAAIKNKATKVQAQRPRSPSPSPREATPESPQSSDAENHPPSSKPSATSKKQLSSTPAHSATTIPLAASTPQMSSPSKRNIIAGLQSEHQWTAVDLDLIFLKSPADKNAPRRVPGLLDEALEKARSGEMTSPEIRMSVEEWIQYNAASAEEKFRNECERMVGIFESEGGRAMRSLEGIMAEEDGM